MSNVELVGEAKPWLLKLTGRLNKPYLFLFRVSSCEVVLIDKTSQGRGPIVVTDSSRFICQLSHSSCSDAKVWGRVLLYIKTL